MSYHELCNVLERELNTEWAKSRYTVISILYATFYMPTFLTDKERKNILSRIREQTLTLK